MVRTSVRLVQWFYWEQGYLLVGAFLVLLVCLGTVGWLGHGLYRTYQEDPLFSFGQSAPTLTAVLVA